MRGGVLDNLLVPHGHVREGRTVREVEHEEDAVGAAVVGSGDGAESLWAWGAGGGVGRKERCGVKKEKLKEKVVEDLVER